MNASAPKCFAFAYGLRSRIPFVGEVRTQQFLYSGGSASFVHWRWWLFGVWLPISDAMTGME